MDDATLLARHWAGLAHFQRTVALHTPGASLLEGEGYVGAVVPDLPDAALVNAVVALDPEAIPAALPVIENAYAQADIHRWGVFVDADALATTDALANAGLALDSMPAAMGAELAAIDLPPALAAPNGTRPATLHTVGAVNDAAYGLPRGRLGAIIGALPPALGDAYAAHADGDAPAATLLAGRHGDDAPIWFVATHPRRRRRGLATALLTHVLARARLHGCTTSTLQASPQGQPLYARLGYRHLGEVHLWEHRG